MIIPQTTNNMPLIFGDEKNSESVKITLLKILFSLKIAEGLNINIKLKIRSDDDTMLKISIFMTFKLILIYCSFSFINKFLI